MWENLFHRKSVQTGIVPVTRYSHPLPRLSMICPKIIITNYPIKIWHFNMLCTKYIYDKTKCFNKLEAPRSL